jgi:hypothetical protein
MSSDLGNVANSSRYFSLAWFRFPIEPEENIKVIEVLFDIILGMSLVSNIILFWMIWKNPDKKPRSSKDLLLANLSIVNVLSTLFGVVARIDNHVRSSSLSRMTLTHKAGAIMLSIILPKYYPSVFLLTLTQYGMIVKPLKFKSMDPQKVKTTMIFLGIHWVLTTAVLIIIPIVYEDFDKYLKVMVTVIVCLSWVIIAFIAYMFIRILHTLWKRHNNLKKRFNVSATQQGTVAIRQNTRLARVLFVFIATLVLCSLPSNTTYLFILHCSQCDQRVLVKACLYTLPLFLALQVIHPIYWLIATPTYYKELKRQARKLLVFCRCGNEN